MGFYDPGMQTDREHLITKCVYFKFNHFHLPITNLAGSGTKSVSVFSLNTNQIFNFYSYKIKTPL